MDKSEYLKILAKNIKKKYDLKPPTMLKNGGYKMDIITARRETNTNPTEKQVEAENYKKGTLKWKGLTIKLENPRGSTRSGTDNSGKKWSIRMKYDYGYIGNTKSKADGDAVDVFIGDNLDSEIVFIIDQVLNGKFDEHKCVIGALNKEEASKIYLSNYEKGWKGLGKINPMTLEQFKLWVKKGNTGKALNGQKLFKMATINSKVPQKYIDMYNTFDDGHNMSHMNEVRQRAASLANKYLKDKAEITDIAATLHDVGLSVSRDNHEVTGADMVANDKELLESIGSEDLKLIVGAIRQHRASTGNPSNTIEKIISDADRNVDADRAIERAMGYGLEHFPHLTRDQQEARAIEHLLKKYSEGGSGNKTYFPETKQKMEKMIEDINNKKDLFKAATDILNRGDM